MFTIRRLRLLKRGGWRLLKTTEAAGISPFDHTRTSSTSMYTRDDHENVSESLLNPSAVAENGNSFAIEYSSMATPSTCKSALTFRLCARFLLDSLIYEPVSVTAYRIRATAARERMLRMPWLLLLVLDHASWSCRGLDGGSASWMPIRDGGLGAAILHLLYSDV